MFFSLTLHLVHIWNTNSVVGGYLKSPLLHVTLSLQQLQSDHTLETMLLNIAEG